MVSVFLNWFYVVVIGLFVCVKLSEADGRLERAWFRHSTAGGVSPAMSNRHCCCRVATAAAAAAVDIVPH